MRERKKTRSSLCGALVVWQTNHTCAHPIFFLGSYYATTQRAKLERREWASLSSSTPSPSSLANIRWFRIIRKWGMERFCYLRPFSSPWVVILPGPLPPSLHFPPPSSPFPLFFLSLHPFLLTYLLLVARHYIPIHPSWLEKELSKVLPVLTLFYLISPNEQGLLS